MTRQAWQTLAIALILPFAINLAAYGETPKSDPKAEPPKKSRYDELALKQSSVADRYAKLESLMAKMAEVEGASNPRRAELLKQAVKQSADNLTRAQLNALVRQLNQKQLGVALPNQKEVATELKQLLELLLSENRALRNKDEKARIREYIKEVEALIRKEKDIQGRTEGGDDTKRLAQDQARVAGQAGGLAKKIQDNEEGGSGKGQGNSENKGDNDGKSKGDSEGKSKGDKEGNSKGDSEGKSKGDSEGNKKGDSEGKSKGDSEGKSKGDKEGNSKGDSEGKSKGDSEGNKKGDSEGKSKGDSEGKSKGDKEGNSKGNSEGKSKGDSEGNKKGNSEGNSKGNSEGNSKGDKEGNSKGNSEGDSKGNSEGNKKGNSEGDSKGGGQGDSKGDSEGDSKGGKAPPGGKQAKQDNPARKRIQAAEEKMRQAQQKLEDAKRKEALEDEQKAREELEKAKAELEEILRQLREEEIERTLAMLEGRFKKMLEMQLKVYESTLRLVKVPENTRDANFDIQSSHLSVDEKKIVVEADKALTLLLEEGSSIAFPETVGQVRDDMQQVVDRLATSKADTITTGIEEDIIKALEEIIDALQKAQQDLAKKKQPPGQPPPPGKEQDKPLVDKIAELKMIRALQMRVNTRTQRYSRLLDDPEHPVGQAADKDLRDALGKLSDRESKVQQITRDIVLGKNQ